MQHRGIYRLCLWAGLDNILGGLVTVLFEILVEQVGKLPNLIIEGCCASPALCRVEKFVYIQSQQTFAYVRRRVRLTRYTCARLRHVEVEHLICLVFRLGQLAVVDSVENGSCVL